MTESERIKMNNNPDTPSLGDRSVAGNLDFPRSGRRFAAHVLGIALAALVGPATVREGRADDPPESIGMAASKPAEGPYVETPRGFMVPYTMSIPGTKATFEMVPIPGGVFKMGSPADEEGREANEGPTFDVRVEPFWMGKYEITWSEYKEYMRLYRIFKQFKSKSIRPVTDANRNLAITAPTELYDPSFTFEKGEDPRQPAVTMTQYAAKQYTKWLSAVTRHQYRLPRESEWEYACRAGGSTPFSFGDDPSQLGEYAWYFENSDETTHPVGGKKANAWGLHDMHGNVAEWTVDQMLEDGYQRFGGKKSPLSADDAVVWPTTLFPRVARGGHWDDMAEGCRSAARLGSNDPDWKDEDPNIPLSPWWFTSDPARGVGFRIVRSLETMSDERIRKYWEPDTEDILADVDARLLEGRGVVGIVDPDLPAAARQLDK
ncbi:MAG: formylglycine-generating enzyme family protein [Planctomycetes bacterium]|nr:formylglycine-generating enzyme family protein [Planctomycetota bacterium]